MDAITLLEKDHDTFRKLFADYEKVGDRAHVRQRDLVARMIAALSAHSVLEEQYFYPVTRATVSGLEDQALEGIEEHHVHKWLLAELEGLEPTDERWKPKVTVLMETVTHHIDEEEDDYFPKVREALTPEDLEDLGDAMAKAREAAPTHPHPKAPDTPPANLVVGTATGLVDKVTDRISGLVQGGVDAVADLVARLRGDERPRRPSPTGSPEAQRVAERVRARAAGALDTAERTGKATVRAAATGAEKTAAQAKRSAKGVEKAAKGAAAR